MRRYEAMYIVDADTPDENLDPVIEKYNKVVTDGGGEIVESGTWEKGRRPLAYEIGKKREGLYVLMQFKSDADVPKELDRIFKINDDVVRHLIVRQDVDEEYVRQSKTSTTRSNRILSGAAYPTSLFGNIP